jgi:hypothetical protein
MADAHPVWIELRRTLQEWRDDAMMKQRASDMKGRERAFWAGWGSAMGELLEEIEQLRREE